MSVAIRQSLDLLWLFSILAWLPACGKQTDSSATNGALTALFEEAKDALVEINLDAQTLEDPNIEFGRPHLGFFVSPSGTILTPAHRLPTTHTVVVSFKSDVASSYGISARVVKRDVDLDLALLEPVRPIPPSVVIKHLALDTGTPVRPGQDVAVLTLTIREDRPLATQPYYCLGIIPGTVFSVFRDGKFSTDIYAFSGISGSPVIAVSSKKVIGVCVQRNFQYETPQTKTIPYRLPDGTSVSLPVPFLIVNYGIARSLTSAQSFLSPIR